MNSLVSYLKSNCASAWSGRVWLDIEGSQYWMSSTSSNQAWYKVRPSPPARQSRACFVWFCGCYCATCRVLLMCFCGRY
jgi:hypothetical protein